MSRLYGKLQGNRVRKVTRMGVNRMEAEILYNFDGKDTAVGSYTLTALVQEDKSINFSLISTRDEVTEVLRLWKESPKGA